jgi:hypothetical protein
MGTTSVRRMPFCNEAELVAVFCRHLSFGETAWGQLLYAEQFD